MAPCAARMPLSERHDQMGVMFLYRFFAESIAVFFVI